MYVDTKSQPQLNSGDLYPKYAYRFDTSKMPIYSRNQANFVNSSVISNRLYNQPPSNALNNRNSGNMVFAPTSERQVNQLLHNRQSLNSGYLGQPLKNLSQQRAVNYSAQQSFDRALPLNSLASNLNSVTQESYRNLDGQPQFRPRIQGRDVSVMDYQSQLSHAGQPTRSDRTSPPRPTFYDTKNYLKLEPHSVMFVKNNMPLRKRNRSETSTESFQSQSSKFQKTMEVTSPLGRRRMDHSKSSRSRRSKREKSPNIFNNQENYDMKRLDLGPSIGNPRYQQELQSRLKAMVYSTKVLSKTEAIVVPSLPSILSAVLK